MTESTLITHNHNTSNILNSKSGYNRSCIPRLTVSMGQRVVADSPPLNNNDYSNEEVEQIIENDVRRARKSRGRDMGDTDNIQVLPQKPPSKRIKIQVKRKQSNTSLIPKDRPVSVIDGPRSKDPVQIDRQTKVELDLNEQSARPSNSNLRTFSIFSRGIGGPTLSSETQTSSPKSKREFSRKPGRKIKVTPPPVNNYKITDLFKPKMNANSDRPNEPGVKVGGEEERDASSVLDKSAVTRPIGL